MPCSVSFIFLKCYVAPLQLHSFPTRRSSDLHGVDRLFINLILMTRYRLSSNQQTRADILTQVNILRSEEHTSELQSRGQLVCRLLLEKKKKDMISRREAPEQCKVSKRGTPII